MDGNMGVFGRIRELFHSYFLVLLIAVYALAATCPSTGDALRGVTVKTSEGGMAFTLPMLLLAVLLFNAGLGANVSELAAIVRRPRDLLAGAIANVLVPVGLLVLLAQGLRSWHDPDEAQCVLVGLAVVAAMPVAGSSTAWSQNANGSTALSLGLVILSTVLSPLTTPFTLAAVGPLTDGHYATALGELGGQGTGTFLLSCVVIPSLAGMIGRILLGTRLVGRAKPAIKLTNAIVLLVLCYANASSVLPKIALAPDWDFLALVLASVVALCMAGFGAGWGLARLLNADEGRKRSLVFAMGMNNNGTGMVLACATLAGIPGAILPVLAYNLVQHLVAGGVNRSLGSAASPCH